MAKFRIVSNNALVFNGDEILKNTGEKKSRGTIVIAQTPHRHKYIFGNKKGTGWFIRLQDGGFLHLRTVSPINNFSNAGGDDKFYALVGDMKGYSNVISAGSYCCSDNCALQGNRCKCYGGANTPPTYSPAMICKSGAQLQKGSSFKTVKALQNQQNFTGNEQMLSVGGGNGMLGEFVGVAGGNGMLGEFVGVTGGNGMLGEYSGVGGAGMLSEYVGADGEETLTGSHNFDILIAEVKGENPISTLRQKDYYGDKYVSKLPIEQLEVVKV